MRHLLPRTNRRIHCWSYSENRIHVQKRLPARSSPLHELDYESGFFLVSLVYPTTANYFASRRQINEISTSLIIHQTWEFFSPWINPKLSFFYISSRLILVVQGRENPQVLHAQVPKNLSGMVPLLRPWIWSFFCIQKLNIKYLHCSCNISNFAFKVQNFVPSMVNSKK